MTTTDSNRALNALDYKVWKDLRATKLKVHKAKAKQGESVLVLVLRTTVELLKSSTWRAHRSPRLQRHRLQRHRPGEQSASQRPNSEHDPLSYQKFKNPVLLPQRLGHALWLCPAFGPMQWVSRAWMLRLDHHLNGGSFTPATAGSAHR